MMKATFSGRLSPLELFHPDGAVERSLILGANCPERLRPEGQCAAGERADLIVVAPSGDECRQTGWLREAAGEVERRLAPGGIVYMMTPRRWRLESQHLLQASGLQVDTFFFHLPNWESSCYIVPLHPMPVQYAFSSLMPARRWKMRLARGALLFPAGAQSLSALFPWTALVARRPGERVVFDWLCRLDGETRRPQTAIVTSSWRHAKESIVLHRFAGADANPSAVVKLGRAVEPGSQPSEAATLERLGPGARKAGANVPHAQQLDKIGGRRVLLQEFIGGRSAAAWLTDQPDRMDDLMERVADWLKCWNLETRVVRFPKRDLMEELLAAADFLAPRVEPGIEYRNWLTRKCAGLQVPVPLVATHNDLTVWNILVDEQGRLGIVDWEAAREEFFPLVDFYYVMLDAVVTARHMKRVEAFRACYAPGGAYTHIVDGILDRMKKSLQISPDWAEVSLHACFLHHAANEARAAGAGDPRPFMEIVEWLAQTVNREAR